MKQEGLIPFGSTFSLHVSEKNNNTRIDCFIASQFPRYSRSFFKQVIQKECVMINNSVSQKPSVLVKKDDIIQITFPPEQKKSLDTIIKTDLGVKIVHKHPHFFILYKPAGLVVHAPNHHSTIVTLVDWLLCHHKEIAHVGYVDRPGIVHRLDKDTSGLLIIPRTNYAYQLLSNLFKQRTIEKQYFAVVSGHPEKAGVINLSVGRNPHVRTKMIALDPQDRRAQLTSLRNATTYYEVVEYFDDYTLVKVKPITGRTHQIRVHFAAIGHPLIGDAVYGKKSKLIQRHALHAYSLSFNFDNIPFSITQKVPDDFQQLLIKNS